VRLLRRGDHAAKAGWASHETPGAKLVAELDDPAVAFSALRPEQMTFPQDWVERVVARSPETVGSVLMLLVRRAGDRGWVGWERQQAVALARRRYAISADDALLAAQTALRAPDDWYAGQLLRVVAGMLQRTIGPVATDDASVATIRELLGSVDRRRGLSADDRSAVRTRLVKLLPVADTGTVDTSMIVPADGWAAVVLPRLATLTHDTAEVTALLRHLAAANGSRPTRAWLAHSQALLEPAPAHAVLRLLLERLTDAQPITTTRWGGPFRIVVDERNADVARAAVWAMIGLGESWVVPTLHRLADRALHGSNVTGWLVGDKVPNACIVSLGQIGTAEAIAALQRLQHGTTDNGFRKRIAAALTVAAAASGLLPGQLAERMVPTGGLSPNGTVEIVAGTLSARASVDDDLKVKIQWAADAHGWAAKPPPDAPKADVQAVRRQLKDLRDMLGAERRRVEALFAADRRWDLADWRRSYLDHPVTGRLARRLIWCVVDGNGAMVAGVPTATGMMRTIDGEGPLPTSGTVALWHPATATTDEVGAWRSWLLDQGVRQPFKQAFREVYLLTPAEQETGTYSNRFAAPVLHYQQAYALFKQRGWRANYLGPYDGGYHGQARHDFPDAGLAAVFEHLQADGGADQGRVQLCTTDRVWFFRTADRARQAVPLEQVPPLVFSEAMRDVDLFVGVSSIAVDPNWADRGDDPYHDYWLYASFGPLSATAEVRRDILARLLPKTKIADRVELGDRYLRVRGNLGTYKVHLGSANILIEPDDRYLCIVPANSARTRRVMLPFDGDEVLTVILSKAMLLAADDKITDPMILHQLKRRA
jgi:Domain of unknown function (DUF4132)